MSGNAKSNYFKQKAQKFLEGLKVDERIHQIISYNSEEVSSLQKINNAPQVDSEMSNSYVADLAPHKNLICLKNQVMQNLQVTKV